MKTRDEEIQGMSLNINATETCTDDLECIMAEEIRDVTIEDDWIRALSTYVMHASLSTRAEALKE